MTVKVISLCDYRRSREEERKSRSGNVLGIHRPNFNEDIESLIEFDPVFEVDPDDY